MLDPVLSDQPYDPRTISGNSLSGDLCVKLKFYTHWTVHLLICFDSDFKAWGLMTSQVLDSIFLQDASPLLSGNGPGVDVLENSSVLIHDVPGRT